MFVNRVARTGALVLALCSGAIAQLNQNCTVSVLNRNVQVNLDGSWVLPNVPANIGQVKARATCVKNGVTTSGESGFFTIPVNGAVNLPDINLGAGTLIPDSLALTPANPTLNGVGQTLELTATAHYPDNSTKNVTVGSTGTNYTSSNPAIATVNANGLVTAIASGTVVIQAINDGTPGMVTAKVVLSGDSDGDGIPNDVEISLGLNPNNPIDAQEDLDRDGLTNLQEVNLGTNLRNQDSDSDGLMDGDEVARGTSPLIADTDGDLIPDGVEVQTGSNPLDRNSYDLIKATAGYVLKPTSFVLTTSVLFPNASQQVSWKVTLIDLKTTLDLTADSRTNYVSSNLNVCNFGAQKGLVFAGSTGSCIITISNSTLSVAVTGTVQSFTPGALSFATIPGTANNVDVAGNYAYVAAGSAGLQVVDVADRSNPRIVSSIPLPGNANDVVVSGNYAYVVGGATGLHIVNVSVPLAPIFAGTFDTPSDAQDVAVRGTRAYVADSGGGLQIIDVTNPASPVRLGSLVTPGSAIGVDVDPVREIAAIAAGGSGLHVVNVANPANPVLLSTLPGGNVRDVALSGNFAFLADFSRSFTSVDLTSPSSPALRGSTPAATGGLLHDVTVFGTFAAGADQFFVNGVPMIDVSNPGSPVPRVIIDFRNFRDDDGTGIAMDASHVYLTAVQSDSRLYIGQYQRITDTAGIPPTVQITSPASGAQVIHGSTLVVTANATDDVAVAAVNFIVNGQLAHTSSTPPYQFTFTAPSSGTAITLGASAVDFGGNVGTAATVVVNLIPDPLTTVTGRVITANRQPVAGAMATLLGRTVTTLADGTFSFLGIPTIQASIIVSIRATVNSSPLTGVSSSLAPVVGGITNVGDIVVVPGVRFFPTASFPTGITPRSMAVADVNKDGKLDLVVGNDGSRDVSIHLGTGDGTFQAQKRFATGAAQSLAVGDVNGDGNLDVVTGNFHEASISVLLGNGDGTFQTEQRQAVAAAEPQSTALVDLDGDGRLDVVTANSGSNNISVLLGNGNGTFQPPRVHGAGGETWRLSVGDVNNDGRLDVVAANRSAHDVSVLLGNGDGTLQSQQRYPVGLNPRFVVLADLNGDGNLDLATANNGSNDVSIRLGNGNGTFQSEQRVAAGNGPHAMVTSDVDGDGRVDLVIANISSNDVSLLIGNGNGTFQPQRRLAVGGTNPAAVAAGDFNTDGRLDLATANNASGDVSVLLNLLPQGLAYVVNSGSNNVSVIRSTTNTVVGTIPVGTQPQGVAASPDRTRVYVANVNSNSVSVIDTFTDTVVATIAVGPQPFGIAVTPDGARAYVTNSSSSGNSVTVINTATNTVLTTITVGIAPTGIAITPDGNRAYVANNSDVTVINTSTNTVVATIPAVGNNLRGVAITPDGTRAYVVGIFSNSLSVIDTATNTTVTTIPVGGSPLGVAITRDGRRAYVGNSASDSVSVIDTSANSMIATVTGFRGPGGLAITTDGVFCYVANQLSNTVAVISTTTNSVVATIPVGSIPYWVAITP